MLAAYGDSLTFSKTGLDSSNACETEREKVRKRQDLCTSPACCVDLSYNDTSYNDKLYDLSYNDTCVASSNQFICYRRLAELLVSPRLQPLSKNSLARSATITVGAPL